MRAIEAGLRFLVQEGVSYIFGIPAGSINALYDCLNDMPQLQPIVAKHENSSGYAATAYTRITGIPSVCVASSGPGATNLVTPCANAWKEKLPVLFITGSVPSTKVGRGGAQELQADAIFAPITKLSKTVQHASELPAVFAEAFATAISGVPGPVHLTIPIDIQMTDIGDPEIPVLPEIQPIEPNAEQVQAAGERIITAGQRGALLLGHGAKSSPETILRFAEQTGWMVATTPRGKGAFPEDHPLSLGVYGLSANEKAISYLHGDQHDVLMVVGSTLGELATSNWDSRLVAGKQLIHIDYDQRELGKCYPTEFPVHGDIELVLSQLLAQLSDASSNGKVTEGISLPNDAALGHTEVAATKEPSAVEWNTLAAIRQLSASAPDNTRFYIDIGEFMTYSIQNLVIKKDQKFDIDINFGGMGSGIGGAIGAKLAEPSRPLLCITGDGCFFMHGMEVLSAKEYGLPIVFAVINNARLGMVYHGHMLQYKRCLSDFEQKRVSIAGMAGALGIRHVEVKSVDQLQPEQMNEWFSYGEPVVVEIIVDGNEVPPMGERVKFLQGATY
ncbi:thiamine pyrophosphate-binding protein [Paenibacillus beijingensis]|uniref:Acetolactate synthase n=1 Tax=Paenibacillus beijingensis TaxID=1126833 RepID=A0A0D5NPB7_9BACL|nr:thiamine pyrophosphate-binding protein [Paenibacillus beijingensis]AJY76758.1 hypothetical protein VN24_22045 [Paenibacillus beijingensis]